MDDSIKPDKDVFGSGYNPFDDYPVLKALKPNGFVRYDAWRHVAAAHALQDKFLPEVDGAMYGIIAAFAEKTGVCKATAITLGALVGREAQAARRSINRLLNCGLIKRVKQTERTNAKALVINNSHPSVAYARAWERGELDDGCYVDGDDRKRETLLELSEEFAAIAQGAPSKLLPDFESPVDLESMVELLKKFEAFVEKSKRAEQTTRKKSLEGAVATQCAPMPSRHPQAALGDDPGFLKLVLEAHNQNKIKEAYPEYRKMIDEGYSPDEILAALEDIQKGIEDPKYAPQLFKWLKGIESYMGSNSARAMVNAERKKQARKHTDPSRVCGVELGDVDALRAGVSAGSDDGSAVDEIASAIASKVAAGKPLTKFERMILSQHQK